ncbi:class I SAM-dependent methyltransferase [soil metagenome]
MTDTPPWKLALTSTLRVMRRTVRRSLGLPVAMDTADRVLLEQTIFPHYRNRDDMRDVLFVGTRWYTSHYPSLLDRQRFNTIDIDPKAAKHGSAHRHVTASAADVGHHFAADSMDLVMFNGVYGWGLDTPHEMQLTLEAFHGVLRPGGELVIGWNDVPRRRPFPLHQVPALSRFHPTVFEPLAVQAVTLPTDNRHRFEFYRKPPSRDQPSSSL